MKIFIPWKIKDCKKRNCCSEWHKCPKICSVCIHFRSCLNVFFSVFQFLFRFSYLLHYCLRYPKTSFGSTIIIKHSLFLNKQNRYIILKRERRQEIKGNENRIRFIYIGKEKQRQNQIELQRCQRHYWMMIKCGWMQLQHKQSRKKERR